MKQQRGFTLIAATYLSAAAAVAAAAAACVVVGTSRIIGIGGNDRPAAAVSFRHQIRQFCHGAFLRFPPRALLIGAAGSRQHFQLRAHRLHPLNYRTNRIRIIRIELSNIFVLSLSVFVKQPYELPRHKQTSSQINIVTNNIVTWIARTPLSSPR